MFFVSLQIHIIKKEDNYSVVRRKMQGVGMEKSMLMLWVPIVFISVLAEYPELVACHRNSGFST